MIYSDISILITITVLVSYFNYRFIKMQATIAILATSFFLSLVLLVLNALGFHVVHHNVYQFISRLHFHDVLMNSLLGLLLFAGSLTINISHLKQQKWEIIFLSTFGVIISFGLIGASIYYLLNFLGLRIPFSDCLLFGALISPTDPIVVLSTLKQYRAPKQLSMILSGESLFNDGIGVVLFLTIYQIIFSKIHFSFASMSIFFLQEAFGGIGIGLLLSLFTYILLHSVDNYKIEILITLALATGGYTLAQMLNVSGPLAMVTIGIFIANRKDSVLMSKETQQQMENFWGLIDELLNAVLFLMIGFEILLVHFNLLLIFASVFAIPIVLFARYIIVLAPMSVFKYFKDYPPYTIRFLTWSGLRGGLAVALALSLPSGKVDSIILSMTYAVVLFSILVQGTTIRPLIRRTKIKR